MCQMYDCDGLCGRPPYNYAGNTMPEVCSTPEMYQKIEFATHCVQRLVCIPKRICDKFAAANLQRLCATGFRFW